MLISTIFFARKIYVQNKNKENKIKKSQNEARTVENIKYEPILSHFVLWFHLKALITLEN